VSAITFHREVKVELGVEEIAAAFASLDSTSQAAFFNEVGKIAEAWPCAGFDTQAHLITKSIFLGREGTQVLRSLSGHFAATDRVAS
jgi:hypothetical protein